jgi:hypothetical protein
VAQVGLLPGDVIVKVDGTATQNLAELYTLTTRLNVARPLPLEIMRQGQTMMVVLPPPMEATMQQPMALQQPGMAPAMPQQPAAWNTAPQPAQPQNIQQPIAQQQVVTPPPQQANPGLWPVAPAAIPPNSGVSGVMGP